MSTRVLIIVNAVGCLVLSAVVVLQWMRERDLQREIGEVAAHWRQAAEERDEQAARCAALEQDVALLKDSVTAGKQAIDERDRQLAQRAAEIEGLHGRIREARVQLAEWERAVGARDQRIAEMEAALRAARERLDEAVRRLNEVSKQDQ